MMLKSGPSEQMGRSAACRGHRWHSRGLSVLHCVKLIGCLQQATLPRIVTEVPLPILYLRNLDNPRHEATLDWGVLCPHPSDDAVERSLTSREISSRLPVVSCQFAKLRRVREVESWRRQRFDSWLLRRYAKRYHPITAFSQWSSTAGRIFRRNSL
jgi:hypothetical protein